MTFGQQLRAARESRKLSQVQVAEMLGLGKDGRRQVGRWEADEVVPEEHAYGVALIYGVPLREFPEPPRRGRPSAQRAQLEVVLAGVQENTALLRRVVELLEP